MLAAKKLSKNKLMAYLAIIALLAIAVGGYLYSIDSSTTVTPEPGIDGSFDISSMGSFGQTKFDLKGLDKFDTKIFSDKRFKDLSELYKEVGIKSPVGRKNPFESQVKASSTTDR